MMEKQLVGAKELLKRLWSDESRPSMRWLRMQIKKRRIPYKRAGRLIWFDLDEVSEALSVVCSRRAAIMGALFTTILLGYVILR